LLFSGKGKVHATATFSASGYVAAVVSVFIFVVEDVVVVITGAVVLVQAMMAYGGWWKIVPVILNLDTN
jgi:hypothetical protein